MVPISTVGSTPTSAMIAANKTARQEVVYLSRALRNVKAKYFQFPNLFKEILFETENKLKSQLFVCLKTSNYHAPCLKILTPKIPNTTAK